MFTLIYYPRRNVCITVRFMYIFFVKLYMVDFPCWIIYVCVCVCVYKSESEVVQSCLTLCNPVDCGPPDSSIRGILQTRVLEWVAISFSSRSSQPRDQMQVSCIAGRCFTICATREAHMYITNLINIVYLVLKLNNLKITFKIPALTLESWYFRIVRFSTFSVGPKNRHF